MTETIDNYITCPYCGLVLALNYIENENLYKGKCPHCGEVLEMDKDEMETTDTEYFFEKE